MIDLTEYLINEAKEVNVPYTLDVYPAGGKNKNFEVTWRVLRGVLDKLSWKFKSKYSQAEYIVRSWIPGVDEHGNAYVPIEMPLVYWDRHSPDREYNWTEYNSIWKRYLEGVTKKYGKVKLKIDWDKSGGRGNNGCLVIYPDDPRFEKDLEEHKKDEEAKKKATEEAEKKRKELEKKGLYQGDHVGDRRNVGKPNEGVLTQWGWYTGD